MTLLFRFLNYVIETIKKYKIEIKGSLIRILDLNKNYAIPVSL